MIATISHSKPWIADEDISVIANVVRSGQIASGEHTRLFEETIAHQSGALSGIAAPSGTAALTLALRTLSVAGKQVIIPSYVCPQVLHAVQASGAEAVLCDIGPDWCMTPDTVATHITKDTACIILVHTFGYRCDVQAFFRFKLPLIEDACQMFPLPIEAAHSGLMRVFSFHATKCLTTGEGGMVVFYDRDVAERAASLKHAYGTLSDVSAALGLSQMERMTTMLSRRKELATRYRVALQNCDVTLPPETEGLFRFALRCTSLSIPVIIDHFASKGIHVRRGVDTLLHTQHPHSSSRFTTAEETFAQTLSLPLYPALSDAEQERVIAVAHALFRATSHAN